NKSAGTRNRFVRITLRDGASAAGPPCCCAAAGAAGAEPNAPTSASAVRFPFAMAQARRIAPPNDSKLLFAPSTEERCIRPGQPPSQEQCCHPAPVVLGQIWRSQLARCGVDAVGTPAYELPLLGEGRVAALPAPIC